MSTYFVDILDSLLDLAFARVFLRHDPGNPLPVPGDSDSCAALDIVEEFVKAPFRLDCVNLFQGAISHGHH